jgi:hypothetical protein
MKNSLQTFISFCIIGFALLFGGAANADTPTANEVAKLLANDGEPYDSFGYSVAIDGDTAVIVAIKDGDNGVNSGSAYIYTRSGVVWTEQQKLTASDGEAEDWFGRSVAIDGDTAVIGAMTSVNGTGSAYVFAGADTPEQFSVLPASGNYAENGRFDIVVTGITASIDHINTFYDGQNINDVLAGCWKSKTPTSVSCGPISWSDLGLGQHTLEVYLDLNNGEQHYESVTWTVY